MKFVIWTDGSCNPNPGVGGFASLIFNEKNELVRTIQGGEKKSTNNRMEYAAALCALREIPDDAEAIVYTDSMLLVNTIEQWAIKWIQAGKLQKKKNANLIEKILAERSRIAQVRFCWVAGHTGIDLNERCDQLANEARYKTERLRDDKWLEIN